MTAIFYCSRRRRTRNLVTTNGDVAIQEENKSLLAQLNDAQTERAQLRTYLQVADTQDPSDVVDVFNKLNVSIKNSCLLTSSAVLKSVELKPEWTTKNASNLTQLKKDLEGAGSLILSEKGAGRGANDFLPLAFCYIVNLTLVNSLFLLFHPGVSKDENKLLSDMYLDIRHHGRFCYYHSESHFDVPYPILFRSSASCRPVALFNLLCDRQLHSTTVIESLVQ